MGQERGLRAASLLVVALCAGCGGGNDGGGQAAASPPPAPDAVEASAAPAAPATQGEAATAGGATFSVDGRALQFDAMPSGHNYYTQLGSQVTARPKVDAAEQLSITFMSIDLRQPEYPAELPRPRQADAPFDPLTAMAGVGFSYRTEDGREWAGPGRVRIDRFSRDGVIAGSFDGVSLPHTDSQLPNITLTGGSFSAQISEPW